MRGEIQLNWPIPFEGVRDQLHLTTQSELKSGGQLFEFEAKWTSGFFVIK
jgi:hypothetical protein